MVPDILNFKKNTVAKILNNRTYSDYYYRLSLLARSVFKWENLPNGINEKWIEKYLFNEGCCMFFCDDIKGYMIARTTANGSLNEYDEPTKLTPVFNNSCGGQISKSYINNKDAVLICNNDLYLPTRNTIDLYALRLTVIQRSIDANVSAMKMSNLIKCSERQKQSYKQAFNQWNEFEPLIITDKDMEIQDSFEVLKTDAPVVFDKLQLQKNAVWNEIMTFLGINNANMDKRERLVDDEVQANNEQIVLSAYTMLKAREIACKAINDIFGLNISVKVRKPQELNIKESEGGLNV